MSHGSHGSAIRSRNEVRRLHFSQQRLGAGFGILNLLDREDNDIVYYYSSAQSIEVSEVDDIHFRPAEPRMVRVRMTYHF